MKITYNTKNINMINKATRLALLDTAEAIKTDLIQSQTVPKDKGDLEGDMFVDDNTLTVNITRLRKKLDELGFTDVIETRRGWGYIIL